MATEPSIRFEADWMAESLRLADASPFSALVVPPDSFAAGVAIAARSLRRVIDLFH